MTRIALTDADTAMLDGEQGGAAALAMRLIVATADISGATELMDITRAHIDGCLFHGQAGLDFAQRLAGLGGRVSVPTTLNVSSLDLLHPDLYRGDAESARLSRLQMDAYVEMGCKPTWTCAPYQLPDPPAFGEQIAWAESNAIAYANSVLGARTERYGDFIDICAAITGRVPASGLHLDENRRGDHVFDLSGVPPELLGEDVLFPLLGFLIGEESARLGKSVPIIVGLETPSDDQLRALGAAAASSGSVGLFHCAGITPEAPAPQDVPFDLPRYPVAIDVLIEIRDFLSNASSDRVGAVSLGTPHASLDEMEEIAGLLDEREVAAGISLYVSTGRDVLDQAEASGLADSLTGSGVALVTDTCTYITPIIDTADAVMTNSAKWAFYAPGNIGTEVIFGSTRECVETAVRGSLWRDEELWRG